MGRLLLLLLLHLVGLLHQAVDLEPVGAAAVAGARLGHANHQALSQPASLARRAIFLVYDALIIVFAFLNHGLIVARSSKEGFAALASECSKVESGRWLFADPAQLVLHGIHSVNLQHKSP